MRARLETPGAHTKNATAAHPREPAPLNIAFFGYDRTDPTIVKRTLAFRAAGAAITGFMFRRRRGMEAPDFPYPMIELGTTLDRRYARRVPALLMGLIRLLLNRATLRRCDVFYARNLDMLALAVAARRLCRSRAPIVYEFLDVQPVQVGTGATSTAFRTLERWLLRRTTLTVVSSQAYITHYFGPRHNHPGPFFILQNKIDAARATNLRPMHLAPEPGRPWVIGWFGVLRCRRTLDILIRIATSLGDAVRIVMRGIPSETDLPRAALETACRKQTNVIYAGPYSSPRDLPKIYGEVHLVWASDFVDPLGNSAWCLTNRIYEGGYLGVPALALAGTATGDMINRFGLGGHSPSSLGTIRDYDVRRALTTAMAALGAPAGAVAARSWTYVGCAAARRRAPTIVPGAPGQRRRRGVRAGEIDCV